IIYQRQLTLYDPSGYVRGGPVHDGHIPALLDDLRSRGFRNVVLDPGPDPIDFNTWGMTVLVEAHHLQFEGTTVPDSQTVHLILTEPGASKPPPCQRID